MNLPRLNSNGLCLRLATLAIVASQAFPAVSAAQSSSKVLTSREELAAAAAQAESAGRTSSGSASVRSRLVAASIRERLANGDFQPGDRIVLTYLSDARHTDTLVVRSGGMVELPAKATINLTGVLRSELEPRISAELLKYVKATQIDVTALTRVGVLGEVTRPGYFALRSDVPLADAIMMAGGPTANADVEHAIVRRGKSEFHSADETRNAVSKGLTLDQLGISAGDELFIPRTRDMVTGSMLPIVGALGSIMAIVVALRR